MPHKPTWTYYCSILGPSYDVLSFLFLCVKKQVSLAKSPVLHWGPPGLAPLIHLRSQV